MSKFIVKQSVFSNSYYIKGFGFTGTKASATRLTEGEAQSVAAAYRTIGTYPSAVVEKADKSFAVMYVRPGDIAANGTVKANTLNPSKRRFATEDEAFTHGARFRERTKDGSTPCNHKGFYVVETQDPVNAYVNQATGLTNSL